MIISQLDTRIKQKTPGLEPTKCPAPGSEDFKALYDPTVSRKAAKAQRHAKLVAAVNAFLT
jgi:hypothetical protein